ncbi:MAG: hypothetical protein ACI861_002199, partial [Paracoccaceae bacterium]
FSLKSITAMLVSACDQLVYKAAIITNRFKVAATPNGSISDPFQPHGPNPIHRVSDTPGNPPED